MYIGIYHIMAVSFLLAVTMSMMMILFWRHHRGCQWLFWLALSPCVGFFATPLWLAHGQIPAILSNGVAQACAIASFGLGWTAMRVFERRAPLHWPLALVLAIWGGLQLASGIREQGLWGAYALTLACLLFSGLSTYELWRGRGEALFTRSGLLVLFAILTLASLVRLPFVPDLPYPLGGQPVNLGATSLFLLLLFFAGISAAVMIIFMTKERDESAHRHEAMSDALTGLRNRRAFDADLCRLANQHAPEFSLLMFDLDRFKSVNDRFGHQVGDQVLRHFAECAREAVGLGFTVFRLGGEEFCCLMPGGSAEQAVGVAERVRGRFEALTMTMPSGPVRCTVSIGVACSRDVGFHVDALKAAADAALYEAKRSGRNQVHAFSASSNPRRKASKPAGRALCPSLSKAAAL